LASTISRDDVIAVIGANSASFPAAGGGIGFFAFWLMTKSLPTKRAPAKETEAYHEIVDIVIDLDLTWINRQMTAAPKPRREEAP
jgi:hypothetical protein